MAAASEQPRSFKNELALAWEAETELRSGARMRGSLCAWPDPKLTGHPSLKACKLNACAIMHLARWWTAQKSEPKPPPIKLVRHEALW